MENKRKLLISGHRGYRALETENTKRAFDKAIKMGLDYIEFDVKRTVEGIPVIFHDSKIDRLMKGSGFIEHMPLSKLRKIPYKDGQYIQTLEEMFQQCAGKIKLMLEIKSGGMAPIIMQLIKKYELEDSVLIQSFFTKHLVECYKEYNDPRIKWGLCQAFLGNLGSFGKRTGLNTLGAKFIYLHQLKPHPFITYLNIDGPFISDEYINLVTKKNYHIILGANKTWKYVDKYKQWNVEIINCDDPLYCVKTILKEAPEEFEFSESINRRLINENL